MIIQNNKIWYLYHSSFLIKIENKALIFDYFLTEFETGHKLNLDKGIINPDELQNENVYVFASHSHRDHYNPAILNWEKKIKNIKYILSSDIQESPKNNFKVVPNREYKIDDLIVKTYESTDEGVAFSVFIKDKHIYFAGDNAFWNWENKKTEDDYIKNVLLKIDNSKQIDIAMQVCDERLRGLGDGGIYIFAKTLNPKLLIPIHSFGKYEINMIAEKTLKEIGFTNKFWCIKKRGDTYTTETN